MNLPDLLDNPKDIRIRPVAETAGDITAYRVILTTLIKEIRREFNISVLPVYKADQQYQRDSESWFIAMKSVAQSAIQRAVERVTSLFERAMGSHLRRFLRSIERATGISIPSLSVSGTGRERELIQTYVQRNTSLIKSLSDDVVKRVEQIVYDGKLNGWSATRVSKELQGQLKIAQGRANLIATDQLSSLNADLNQYRNEALGIKHYRWVTRGDARVRSLHRQLNGQRFEYGKPTGAEGGLPPGKPVRCFPGHSKVDAMCLVNRAYRRFYSGKLTQIVTKSGKTIQSTPNHPHLTVNGWRAAHEIKVGDHVVNVGNQGIFTLDADTKNCVSSIQEHFDFFALVFGSKSTDGMLGDFHGDGLVDHDIDIVDIKGELRLAEESLISKGFKQEDFTMSDDDRLSFLATLRNIQGVLPLNRLSSHSFVGLFGEVFSLLFVESTHANEIRFRAIAEFYSFALKICGDALSRQFVPFTQSEDAITSHVLTNKSIYVDLFRIWWGAVMSAHDMAGFSHPSADAIGANSFRFSDLADVHAIDVEFDAVIDNFVTDFSGHVYNLETDSGWYLSEGILTKNCRCVSAPLIPAKKPNIPRRAAIGAAATGLAAAARALGRE